MDIKSKEFKRLVHQRMLRFYAVSCILRHKNFAKFLKNFVLPGINKDRPYKTNVIGWEVDCYIKANINAIFSAFIKTANLIGHDRFLEQVKEEVKLLDDIAALSGQAERFGGSGWKN